MSLHLDGPAGFSLLLSTRPERVIQGNVGGPMLVRVDVFDVSSDFPRPLAEKLPIFPILLNLFLAYTQTETHVRIVYLLQILLCKLAYTAHRIPYIVYHKSHTVSRTPYTSM